MIERNSFALSFNTNVNKVLNLSVPRASKTLTPGFVAQRMQDLISIGIINHSANGYPVSVRGAELVMTEITPVV